jgi:transcriptional regulator with XRE-family HTH domain
MTAGMMRREDTELAAAGWKMWDTWRTTLRDARRQIGSTQRELAAKIGMPQGALSDAENGVINAVRLTRFFPWARELGFQVIAVPNDGGLPRTIEAWTMDEALEFARLRILQGRSQRYIADVIDVSDETASRIEGAAQARVPIWLAYLMAIGFQPELADYKPKDKK